MKLFRKRTAAEGYDPAVKTPVIKASVCTGEQVAGFRDLRTGAFEDVMLVRTADDLKEFRDRYGIKGDIEKIY